MKKVFIITIMLIIGLTYSSTQLQAQALFNGVYWLWQSEALYLEHDINKAVVKVQEHVWDYRTLYDPNSPGANGAWGEFVYQYDITNLFGPVNPEILTSYAILKKHEVVHAQALTPGWNIYPDWPGGMWINANAPYDKGGLSTGQTATFRIWINDMYSNPNDADHGYVGWSVNFNWGSKTKPYWQSRSWGEGGLWGDPVSAPVPEPGTLLLLGSGLIGFGVIARIRRKRS